MCSAPPLEPAECFFHGDLKKVGSVAEILTQFSCSSAAFSAKFRKKKDLLGEMFTDKQEPSTHTLDTDVRLTVLL